MSLSIVFKDINDFEHSTEYYNYLDNLLSVSNNKLNILIEECIDGYTYNCAKLLYFLYKDKYVCGKLKTKLWFCFNGLKWQQTELGPYKELSTNILYLFERYKYLQEKENNDSNNETNSFEKINNLILKLKNVNYKENVCKECLYLFYSEDFISQLDKKYNLICFNNGVLDIKNKTFRNGFKDDYISLSIDKEYNQNNIENINSTIEKFVAFRQKILNKRKPIYLF